MLNFFKRQPAPAEPTLTTSSVRPTEKRRSAPNSLEPLPTPQVVEGNEDSDWAMWEDSVSFMDSRMPTLEQDSVRVRQAQGSTLPPQDTPSTDPFASVGRRGS